MTHLNLVAISGSVSSQSRTLALTEAIVADLAKRLTVSTRIIKLGAIARDIGAALSRSELSTDSEEVLQSIEAADLLIVTSPVYRGSYPGLLKHLFDLVDLNALIDTPVLLAATGGSDRHALIIDHQLRPLLSFFQALTLPIGVYASEADYDGYQLTGPAITARVALAGDRAARWFGNRKVVLQRIA